MVDQATETRPRPSSKTSLPVNSFPLISSKYYAKVIFRFSATVPSEVSNEMTVSEPSSLI